MNEEIEILKEHLKIATRLESEAYTYQELLDKIKFRISQLNNKAFYCDSSYAIENEFIYNDSNKSKYVKDTSKLSKKSKIIIILISLFFVFPVIILLMMSVLNLIAGNNNHFGTNEILMMAFLVLIHAIIPIAVILLIVLLVVKNHKKKARRSFEISLVKHQQDLAQSQKDKQNTQCSIKQYSQVAELVCKYIADVDNRLKKHYSQDLLYSKYRNFVAVATMYEWLCSGVCTEIKGHGGLYDRYEDYIQKKEIITEVKQVKYLLKSANRKLDTMIMNQNIIIKKIDENNKICEDIYNSLTQIEYNEILQSNYLNYIDKQMQSINARESYWY